MKNNKVPLIDYIFSSEYENYSLLEEIIFKLYDLYKTKNNSELKDVLRQNIIVAKKEISIMLEIISLTIKDDKIKKIEATLNAKLIAMDSIERHLIMEKDNNR